MTNTWAEDDLKFALIRTEINNAIKEEYCQCTSTVHA